MHYRYFKAVASCALAIAFASATTVINAAQWTSFPIGKIGMQGFGFALDRLPDGRFVLGDEGSLYVQKTWGAATKTQISSGGVTFDPSFVAVRNATSGLVGGGGYPTPLGLYGFNPSATGTAVSGTSLVSSTLQNFCAVYWKHPASGREGWLIGGTNGAGGKHNLTFVSADGTKVGAVTGVISTYSSGICTDAVGNVYAARSEFFTLDAADSEKVLKFTATQIDAAVAAVISGTPAPVDRADAIVVHQFDGASSIAVDSTGRLWAGNYSGYLQVYDPLSNTTRDVMPDHAPIAGAAGPTAYQVQVFNHAGVEYIGFLANDLFGAGGTNLVQGYKPVSEIPSRGVSFEQTAITKNETDGTVTISVDIVPAPTAKVTVPITFAGTAVKGKNYTATQTSLVFGPNDASQTQDITLKIINNTVDDMADKTVVVRLGAPAPVTQAYAIPGKDVATLTITDDDHKPVIASVQNFIGGKVGTGYSYQIQATGATKFTVTGLPKGMTYNQTTGLISGSPTEAGEYDQIWITATNAAGVSTSTGYYLKVEDFNPVAGGNFVGFVDRAGAATSTLGGRIDLSITKAATFTGKLTVGATAYPLSGPLDTSTANPTGSATYVRSGVTYTVAFNIDASTGALGGTVGTAAISGWKSQTETLLTGLHNFITERAGGPIAGDPQGASYGTATVAATGTAAVSIHTSDGAVFATSAPLGPDGQVLVCQTAYTTIGSLLGNLTIANDGPHTMGGSLSWSRPPQATGGWLPEIPLAVRGGKYRPVSGSAIVMNLAASSGNNASLGFEDGGLANPVTVSFRISTPALVTIPAPYKLTVTNSTGAFSGSFKPGAVVVPFQGVVVPTTTTADPFDGAGNGYFLTPGTGSVVIRSGLVSLDPVL